MKRLRYVSRFNRELTAEEVTELARRSQIKNAERGLTGLLMTSGKLFFQVLEGPAAAVDEIFGLIVQDPRHTDLLVLDTEYNVTERLFPDWSMRQVNLDDAANVRLAPARQDLEQIVDLRFQLDKLTYRLERTIWEELARAG